jgi:hypothetical protein
VIGRATPLTPLAGLIALAGALSACKRPAPTAARPRVVEVRIVDRTPDGARPAQVDAAVLGRAAAAAITETGGLPVLPAAGVADDTNAPGARYRLKVDVRLEEVRDDRANKGVMRAYVEAKLSPIGEGQGAGGYAQAAAAEREFDPATRGDAQAAWATHTERAVRDVVSSIGARVRIAGGDAAALLAAMRSTDEDLRDEAIRVAAERREPSAVPLLIAMLRSDDHLLRDRAIGALAAIGDPKSVRPLTEVARFRDVTDLPKVLDALAAIGGPEARAYLEFVASGHDSPEMREMAEKALAHLDKRASPPVAR